MRRGRTLSASDELKVKADEREPEHRAFAKAYTERQLRRQSLLIAEFELRFGFPQMSAILYFAYGIEYVCRAAEVPGAQLPISILLRSY